MLLFALVAGLICGGIVAYQDDGDITRNHTYAMADQFEADLEQLKKEAGL